MLGGDRRHAVERRVKELQLGCAPTDLPVAGCHAYSPCMRTFTERRTGRGTRRPPCVGCDEREPRAGGPHGQVLELQRSVGNGAVVAMLSQAQRLEDHEYEDSYDSGSSEPQSEPEPAPEAEAQEPPEAGESAEVEPTQEVEEQESAAPHDEVPQSDDGAGAASADEPVYEDDGAAPESDSADPDSADPESAEPLPAGPFYGEETEVVVEGKAFSFKGKTTAKYAHSWDHANDVVNGNVRSGDLVETYSVATNVSLPSLPKGLSECEEAIVDDAINNKLAAHEQAHVDAFHNNFDGTVTTSYSETGGAAQVTAKLEAKHQANKAARQAKADSESAKLDPFQIDADTSSCDKTSMNETAPANDDSQNG